MQFTTSLLRCQAKTKDKNKDKNLRPYAQSLLQLAARGGERIIPESVPNIQDVIVFSSIANR